MRGRGHAFGRCAGAWGSSPAICDVCVCDCGEACPVWAIREIGISQSELARHLHIRETAVRRMLDPNHDTRPEKIQAALEALGRRVVMAYYDAA